MPEDQAAWIEQLRAGDELAVREMIRAYGVPLTRFLTGMTGNQADAEDLTQETFLRFLQHAPEFRGEASVKTYLFRIAHNLALNEVTSASRKHEIHPEEMPDVQSPASVPLQSASNNEEAGTLRKALAKLPPQQRAVVILRTWQDLSFKEIASAMSLAEGTTKAHYFFALRNMRRTLGEGHDPR